MLVSRCGGNVKRGDFPAKTSGSILSLCSAFLQAKNSGLQTLLFARTMWVVRVPVVLGPI